MESEEHRYGIAHRLHDAKLRFTDFPSRMSTGTELERQDSPFACNQRHPNSILRECAEVDRYVVRGHS